MLDYNLSDEQLALQQAARAFFRSEAGPGTRDVVDRDLPAAHSVWATMSEQLGILGIAVSEEYGGAGGTFLDLVVVLEEAGRTLLCQPLFSTAVLGALTLQHQGDEEALRKWLPSIAAGELQATLAFLDKGPAAFAQNDVDGSWAIQGIKTHVVDGKTAQLLIVSAQTPDGLSMFLVEGDAGGLERQPMVVTDKTMPLAELTLNDVPATLLGPPGTGSSTLQQALTTARIAIGAYQVGGAQACLDLAVDYAKTRTQFGQPIGAFQSIKHMCADMFVDVEASRTALHYAAWSFDQQPEDLTLVADMTQSFISSAFQRVATATLQVFGGIGYTWEHDAHLYYKRALATARLFGTSRRALDSIASEVGLDGVRRSNNIPG